ncbi:hypothetical protein [Streptomyces sp. NPDC002156]
MENSVVRAVYEIEGQFYDLPPAGTLERGAPATLSAFVGIAARTVLPDDPTSVPLVDGTAT